MRALLIALLAVATPAPALAQHAGHDPHAGHGADAAPLPAPQPDPHAGHDMGAPPGPTPPLASPPAAAVEGPRHAADALFGPSAMAAAREQLRAEHGETRTYRVMIDQLEARIRDDRDGYLWDTQAWYGGDIDKLWLKTEGEGGFSEKPEQAEVQVLWSHAVTPWFDAQAGLRYDFRPDPERGHLVLGLQGLAPYYFEIDAAAFLSDEGDLTARFEAEYDQLITQKLIVQPRIELDLAAQDVREIGVGSGLSSAEAGLRLRYEFVPEFAPYIGVEYERKFGETADFARDEGEDAGEWSILLGVRAWF
jgi:copper resistance protein B